MRHASVGVVVALLALWAGPGAVAAPMSKRMVDQINQTREQASLPALERAPALERSAGAFARWLLDHNTLTHRPAVSTNRAYPHRGEALSMHFSLQARIGPTLKAWLGSPTHRGLVMTTSMDMIGVGHARGRVQGRPRTVWVVQVARD